MRASGPVLLILFACAGCEICTSDNARRCNGATLEVCRDGDWIPQQCLDGGVATTCQVAPDGGAEC
jgi:hypothetical protein